MPQKLTVLIFIFNSFYKKKKCIYYFILVLSLEDPHIKSSNIMINLLDHKVCLAELYMWVRTYKIYFELKCLVDF